MPDPWGQFQNAMYAILEADTQLDTLAPGGVWAQNAPLTVTAYPYLAFQLAAGSDAYTLSRYTGGSGTMNLRAVTKGGSASPCRNVLDRVFVLLSDAALSVTGFPEVYCRRIGRTETAPLEQGVQYQNVVDQYRFEAHQ